MLDLAFPSEKPVLLEAARRYSADEAVAKHLRAYYGGLMQLSVSPKSADERDALPERSLAEANEIAIRQRKNELRRQALSHPTVEQAIRIFDVDERDVDVGVTLAQSKTE